MKNKQRLSLVAILTVVAVVVLAHAARAQDSSPKLYCDKGACPEKPVTLEGDLKPASSDLDQFSLTVSDAVAPIEIKLRTATPLDKIKFLERNHLIKGGTIRARVTGAVHYGEVFRIKLTPVNGMEVSPENIQFISDGRCPGEKEPRVTLASGNCFDFSGFPFPASAAYERLIASPAYQKNKCVPPLLFYSQPEKIYKEFRWVFTVVCGDESGQCPAYAAYVAANRVGMEKRCPGDDGGDSVSVLSDTGEKLCTRNAHTENYKCTETPYGGSPRTIDISALAD
jgi:hypothetical protein